jgi:uncharacterized protein YceK
MGLVKARSLVALVVVLAAGVLVAGCGAIQSRVPTAEPSIRGVVTSVAPGAMDTSIRVVWTDDPAVGEKASLDAAQVEITDATDVLRKTGDTLSPVSPQDFETGDVVEAWFAGAVAESYPVQATAATVLVVGHFSGPLPVPPGL